jgi:hypothetical protein
MTQLSTSTATRLTTDIDLGDDPFATIVGVLRDLSRDVDDLVDRVSALEARAGR